MSNGIGSDWTVNTLYTHLSCMLQEMEKRLDERLEAQHEATMSAFKAADKATTIAMTAAKEAVDKAEKLASQRADQQNEWRATVEDLTKTRLPRIEYELGHKTMEAQLQSLEKHMEAHTGETRGANTTIAWVIAGAGVFVAAISVVLNIIVN